MGPSMVFMDPKMETDQIKALQGPFKVQIGKFLVWGQSFPHEWEKRNQSDWEPIEKGFKT